MNASVENAVVPRLGIDQVIEFGQVLLEKTELPLGLVQMHSRKAKHQLRRIYGETGPHLDLFRDPPKGLTATEAHRFIQDRNTLLKEIRSRLDLSLHASNQGQLRIFFGHGGSHLWRELKDFVAERLKLPWEEFNRVPTAGYATAERLNEMLDSAGFAFLIMTAEEEHADATFHARSNVIHEVGLFQGRLGMRKAIVLLEEGCSEFSNIVGLTQIRFPKGRISAVFEDVRAVLEREQMIV